MTTRRGEAWVLSPCRPAPWVAHASSMEHSLRWNGRLAEDEAQIRGLRVKGRFVRRAHGQANQLGCISRFPVFGDTLAGGDATQYQLVPDGGIECRAQLDGFVNLGKHGLLYAG